MSDNIRNFSETHRQSHEFDADKWRPVFIWDTETTGLSPTRHRMIEIAAMEIPATSPYKTPLTFSSLIHPPDVSSPRSSLRTSGVTNKMMQDAPSFPEVWEAFSDFITDACRYRQKPILVAHNLQFDLSFLQAELKRSSLTLPDWDFACSLRDLVRITWPGEPASLKALCDRLAIINEEPHRAISDVKATAEIVAKVDEELALRASSCGQMSNKKGSNIYFRICQAAKRHRWRLEKNESKDVVEDIQNTLHKNTDIFFSTKSSNIGVSKVSSKNRSHIGSQSSSHRVRVYHSHKGKLWHSHRDCSRLDFAKAIIQVSITPRKRLPCSECIRRGQRALAKLAEIQIHDDVEGHNETSKKSSTEIETSSRLMELNHKLSKSEADKRKCFMPTDKKNETQSGQKRVTRSSTK